MADAITDQGPVVIAAHELERYVASIVEGHGAPAETARTVAASLVSSNLAGHDSHGALLLPYWMGLVERGQIRPDAETEVVLDLGAVVSVDGRFGFGPAVAHEAVDIARNRAQTLGIACVLARNANHIGRLGEYTSALAQDGFVSLLFVNCQGSGQLLAPFGGAERRLTNNPISIAAPGGTSPVLLDMALSVAAEAKVWLAQARGESVPEGWIVDAEGQPTTDPGALLADGGALLPLGGAVAGHKGYGLIVLVDILAGILSGGGVCRPNPPEDFSNAFLLIALDVEPLSGESAYASQLEVLRQHVTQARRRPNVSEILFPGDAEAVAHRTRSSEGIPIDARTWQDLADVAEQVGVPRPRV